MKTSSSKRYTWLSVAVAFATVSAMSTGCPRPRGDPAFELAAAQRIYKLPFDRVWDTALAIVTEDLKYPLEIVERSTGLITTEWVKFEKKPGDYQEGEMITLGQEPRLMLVNYRIMVMVKKTPDGTMIRVRRFQENWIDRWTPVATDLKFERQFLLIMDRRLGVTPEQIL